MLSMSQPQPRKLPYWGVIAAILLIGGVALGWAQADNTQPLAPEFTFTGYNGSVYRLTDLRGKVIVLNFWANWCIPCHAEAPTLQRLWGDLHTRDVIFLGVSQDDMPADAQAFIDEFQLGYPNGPDNGLADLFGVHTLPVTIIIDRQGYITDRLFSAITANELRSRIERALHAA